MFSFFTFLSRLSLGPEKPPALPEKRYSIIEHYHASAFLSIKGKEKKAFFGLLMAFNKKGCFEEILAF